MTKARGAADSIGKAGRGASFLLPAFSPYYVPYFPLFLRARARAHRHTSVYTRPNTHIYIHTYPRSLSFLSSPPPGPPPAPRQPLVLSSFTLHAVLLLASLLVVPRRLSSSSSSSSLLYVRVHARARVYVRLVSIVVREVSCRTAPRSRGERAALYVGERENVF